MTDWSILEGDCLALLPTLAPESFDAVVTDPPYGLGFMGKAWDADVGAETWRAVLAVMKPGAHLLAFGGTRTFHRLAVAIEDAGFEIRDCLVWLYGSGFPKSLDVAKALDKAAGAERRILGQGPFASRRPRAAHAAQGLTFADDGYVRPAGDPVTEPVTDQARAWSGWGTALKPAWEPILLARKPLAGTVAENVMAHGTGGLNVDACRIAAPEGRSPAEDRRATARRSGRAPVSERSAAESQGEGRIENRASPESYMAVRPEEGLGRWPANVVLDPEAAAEVDRQSGPAGGAGPASGPSLTDPSGATVAYGGRGGTSAVPPWYGDLGGASRFFYTAKADQAERDVGLDGRNVHPTVKPVALMTWLVRLVTPPGGLVLDPFAGSGTTGMAALREGRRFLGIERDPGYAALARARIVGDAPLLNTAPGVLPEAVPVARQGDLFDPEESGSLRA